VSRRRDSVAGGPAIGGMGGICGVAVLRLRLLGDGDVATMVDFERVVRWYVAVVAGAVGGTVLLRLGLEIMCSAWRSLVVFNRLWDIVVLEAHGASYVAVPLWRNCCSLPLKLVILLTGTSSTVSSAVSSSSTLGWISVDGGILSSVSRIGLVLGAK
jgi:hypothetical protein